MCGERLCYDMKKIGCFLLVLLLNLTMTMAQGFNIRECREDEIPSSSRADYYREAHRIIENHYIHLLESVGNTDNWEVIIEQQMHDKSATTLKTEFLLTQDSNLSFCSPSQYFTKFESIYRDMSDKVDFVVDNFKDGEIMMKSLVSCYIPVEYDLALMQGDKTLFKRRCRMLCLFPRATASKLVKVMQVEPVRDIIAYQPLGKDVKRDITPGRVKGAITDKSDRVKQTVNIDTTQYNILTQRVKAVYDYKYTESEGFSVIRKDSLYGFVNHKDELIVKPRFQYAWPYKEGVARFQLPDGFGFVNKQGKITIPCMYSEAQDFREGLACVKFGQKYGFIDFQDNMVIPAIYEAALSFSDGLAAVKLNGLWGFVNHKGETVIPCIYKEARSFSNGRAAVCSYNSWGFIDKQGILCVKTKYKYVSDFKGNIASVWNHKNKSGVIDIFDNIIVPIKHEIIRLEENNIALAIDGYDYKYFTDKGTKLNRLTFREADEHFFDGCARVRVKDSWGFIYKDGRIGIPVMFDDARPFSEGLSAVKIKGKWGYINNSSVFVIEPQFERAMSFSDDIAIVNDGNGWLAIDKKGKKLFDFPKDLEPNVLSTDLINKNFKDNTDAKYSEGLLLVRQHSGLNIKYGFIDTKGNNVIPCTFDKMSPFKEGKAFIHVTRVRVDRRKHTYEYKKTYIDTTGKIIK